MSISHPCLSWCEQSRALPLMSSSIPSIAFISHLWALLLPKYLPFIYSLPVHPPAWPFFSKGKYWRIEFLLEKFLWCRLGQLGMGHSMGISDENKHCFYFKFSYSLDPCRNLVYMTSQFLYCSQCSNTQIQPFCMSDILFSWTPISSQHTKMDQNTIGFHWKLENELTCPSS
jgi:hypothetical protein